MGFDERLERAGRERASQLFPIGRAWSETWSEALCDRPDHSRQLGESPDLVQLGGLVGVGDGTVGVPGRKCRDDLLGSGECVALPASIHRCSVPASTPPDPVHLGGAGGRRVDHNPTMQTITWKGRLGPLELQASENTFQPSTISTLVAKVLEVKEGDVVIDVGCGTGILGIIAAKLGAAKVYGVDASPDVVAVGSANAATHGVADRMEFYHGDLFGPLPKDVRADVIIGDVSGIPDALAADSGWFPSKTGGGPRGSELPVRMLAEARRWLKEGGRLLLPTGTLQDENAILDAARTAFGTLKKLIDRMIPLAGPLAESPSLKELVDAEVVHVTPRGSRFVWEARVWECEAGT